MRPRSEPGARKAETQVSRSGGAESRTKRMSGGEVVQIIGAVVDVEFPRGEIPRVYDALRLEEQDLTLEVQQQLGDGVVRAIAMGSTDGLKRGVQVLNTGEGHLRAGRPEDPRAHRGRARASGRRGRRDRGGGALDHPPGGARLRRPGADGRAAGDRHQGRRPHLPLRQGRQGGALRGRRRRQDRLRDGADSQHRDRAQRLLRLRRGGRAHSGGQRPLPRDDGERGSSTRWPSSTGR